MKSNLKETLNVHGSLVMYVGNLEGYQGIDLLLESFALVQHRDQLAHLAIIGGQEADIQKYSELTKSMGISKRVSFLGPRPVEDLKSYLDQADILVSPRTKGKNTPMKLYSYLDSGKALLATDLPTHTQVLNSSIAMLADSTPNAFSQGMLKLLSNASLRSSLGKAGKKMIQEGHTFDVFQEKLNALYTWLESDLMKNAAAALPLSEAV